MQAMNFKNTNPIFHNVFARIIYQSTHFMIFRMDPQFDLSTMLQRWGRWWHKQLDQSVSSEQTASSCLTFDDTLRVWDEKRTLYIAINASPSTYLALHAWKEAETSFLLTALTVNVRTELQLILRYTSSGRERRVQFRLVATTCNVLSKWKKERKISLAASGYLCFANNMKKKHSMAILSSMALKNTAWGQTCPVAWVRNWTQLCCTLALSFMRVLISSKVYGYDLRAIVNMRARRNTHYWCAHNVVALFATYDKRTVHTNMVTCMNSRHACFELLVIVRSMHIKKSLGIK